VDTQDVAFGDRRTDDASMGQAGHVELGGIFGGAGDLRNAVDAGSGGADVGWHGCLYVIFLLGWDCGVPRAACESAPTMARRARSILNVLCPKPLASCRTRSAAWANAASPAGRPRSAASACAFRQGLCATPPSAKRASRMVPPSSSRPTATETSAKA